MRSLPSQFLQEASKLLLKAVASIQGHTPVYLVQHSTPRNMDSSLFASTKMSSRFSAAAAVAKSSNNSKTAAKARARATTTRHPIQSTMVTVIPTVPGPDSTRKWKSLLFYLSQRPSWAAAPLQHGDNRYSKSSDVEVGHLLTADARTLWWIIHYPLHLPCNIAAAAG